MSTDLEYLRTYRQTHRAEIRVQKRDYYARTGNRYIRGWREKNPGLRAEYRQRWQDKHPEKYAAHNAVWSAIRAGQLRPAREFHCVDCGQAAKEYDHHLGYAPEHRLNVQPVCRPCHGKRRRIPTPGKANQ